MTGRGQSAFHPGAGFQHHLGEAVGVAEIGPGEDFLQNIEKFPGLVRRGLAAEEQLRGQFVGTPAKYRREQRFPGDAAGLGGDAAGERHGVVAVGAEFEHGPAEKRHQTQQRVGHAVQGKGQVEIDDAVGFEVVDVECPVLAGHGPLRDRRFGLGQIGQGETRNGGQGLGGIRGFLESVQGGLVGGHEAWAAPRRFRQGLLREEGH